MIKYGKKIPLIVMGESFIIKCPLFLRSEILTEVLTARSDKTRADVIGDALPEDDPDSVPNEQIVEKDKEPKKAKDKEKGANQKSKSTKPKTTERKARRDNNLKIDNPNQARSKSATRSKSASRRGSLTPRDGMEWDGKKWVDKNKKEAEDDQSERSHRSDRSEISFMDSQYQDKLLDKLCF